MPNRKKPLPFYPSDEERKKLEFIKKSLGKKTLSGTIRSLIKMFYDFFKKD